MLFDQGTDLFEKFIALLESSLVVIKLEVLDIEEEEDFGGGFRAFQKDIGVGKEIAIGIELGDRIVIGDIFEFFVLRRFVAALVEDADADHRKGDKEGDVVDDIAVIHLFGVIEQEIEEQEDDAQ